MFRNHLESFLAQARERSSHGRGLPAFVERDLRAYTECGILARGFGRVRCPDCGFERLVAFSCKASLCPSCATRRMEDGADHLVRNVFPAVPVRQWVLSFPRQARFLAARHPALASRLLEVFTRRVGCLRRANHVGPVLVDDMVDSRWTLTVSAWLLRRAGAGPVWPVALAMTGRAE